VAYSDIAARGTTFRGPFRVIGGRIRFARRPHQSDIEGSVSSINPFSGYVAQGSQLERTQAAEKTRQVRRAQALSKNVAARDDELEHQVENTDVVAALHDEQQGGQGQQQQSRQEQSKPDEGEGPAHIDITA
jgi:hypothetical protein